MIKIVRDEKIAKKYLNETKRLFDLYKCTQSFLVEEDRLSANLLRIIQKIKDNSIEIDDCLKRDIINENLLGDRTLSDLAAKYSYSVSYIYAIKQKVLREFAMVLFEVVIL